MADNQAGDELNRWLRVVRPPTAADQDWTDSAAADALLAAVHSSLDEHRSPGRRWLLTGVGLAAAAAVLVLVLTAGLLSGRPDRPVPAAKLPIASTGPTQQPTIRPAAMLLNRYDSCPQLLADLRGHTAASVTPYGLPGVLGGYDLNYALAPSPVPQAAGASEPNQTSTTNVQEPGVDEPDTVKTETLPDGRIRVISLVGGILRVIDAGSRRLTGSVDLSMYAGWQAATLLVAGDHALVLLGGGTAARGGIYSLPAPVPGAVVGSRSSFLFVDLAGQPKVTGSLRTSGYQLDARLAGSTVRLVVRSAPTLSFPNGNGSAQSKAANQRIVRQAALSAWLPQYTLTDGTAVRSHTVPCDQVSHPAAFTGTSLLTVYSLDLNRLDSTADPQPISVAADGDTVYATASSLYIASNPDWFCCQATAQRTELHRFDISGTGQPRYLGSGSVPGRGSHNGARRWNTLRGNSKLK